MQPLPVEYHFLSANYPRRDAPEIAQIMAGIGGTPCCCQLSYALNLSEIRIPEWSNRRRNTAGSARGVRFRFLLCVDEVINFLTKRCGGSLRLDVADDGSRKSYVDMKRTIELRQGILAFSDRHYGFHVELWNGRSIHQRDINETFCFGKPEIFFWDCGLRFEDRDYSSLNGL